MLNKYHNRTFQGVDIVREVHTQTHTHTHREKRKTRDTTRDINDNVFFFFYVSQPLSCALIVPNTLNFTFNTNILRIISDIEMILALWCMTHKKKKKKICKR